MEVSDGHCSFTDGGCIACEEGGVKINMRETGLVRGRRNGFFYLHLLLFRDVLRGRTVVKTSSVYGWMHDEL